MKVLLLSVHVLGSVVFIGPVTVATSLFPRYARAALAGGDCGVVDLLHRISRGYAVLGVSVPVFGIATGAALGVLLQPWLVVSMVLTAVAAALLALVLIPGQASVVAALDNGGGPVPALKRLSMVAGIFALTWAVVVVLMIARPGSTTGVAH